jgi:hypothetical protein
MIDYRLAGHHNRVRTANEGWFFPGNKFLIPYLWALRTYLLTSQLNNGDVPADSQNYIHYRQEELSSLWSVIRLELYLSRTHTWHQMEEGS